jgi:hypothetical protein
MGLFDIIKNNPNWNNNVDSVYINNNICKTMKEINKGLEEEFKNQEKNNKNSKKYEEKQKEREKKKKEKEEEENKNKNKNKNKFNNNYFNLLNKIVFSINKYKNIFRIKSIYKKLKIC